MILTKENDNTMARILLSREWRMAGIDIPQTETTAPADGWTDETTYLYDMYVGENA